MTKGLGRMINDPFKKKMPKYRPPVGVSKLPPKARRPGSGLKANGMQIVQSKDYERQEGLSIWGTKQVPAMRGKQPAVVASLLKQSEAQHEGAMLGIERK